uniref:Candidate secreted effector n=1 Tax=Meloidogyne incognita TaxID=6306 RepID=A0A914KHS5_MELIC
MEAKKAFCVSRFIQQKYHFYLSLRWFFKEEEIMMSSSKENHSQYILNNKKDVLINLVWLFFNKK